MIGEADEESGEWLCNEPQSEEGWLAWSLGQTPALWLSMALVTPVGGSVVLQGFDHPRALELARQLHPGLDAALFHAAARGMEAGRMEVEQELARESHGSQE